MIIFIGRKFLDRIASYMATIAVLLSLFNWFGAIVSLVWLLVLGEWRLIGYGLLSMLGAGIFLSILLMPAFIFTAPLAAFERRNIKIGAYFFALLSVIYKTGVLSIWCIAIFVYHISQATPDSIFPVLVWSHNVATGPIIWLASKDLQSGNEYAMVSTFFIQIAYLLSILSILLLGFSLTYLLVIFTLLMTLAIIYQFSISQIEEMQI